MLLRLASLLLLLSFEAGASEPGFIKSLENLILHKNLTTIEAVVRELPDDLRSQFTLVHSGRALLESSPEYPAVILFGKDAKNLLAFNGHSSQRGYSSLDVLSFDKVRGEYIPARFFFSPDKQTLNSANSPRRLGQSSVYLEQSPSVCMSCHGPKHHPIFESSYPEWDGFYGSSRDHLYGYEGRTEGNSYKEFLAKGFFLPRYQSLLFPDLRFSKVSPYLDQDTEKLLSIGEAHRYRPNLMFGALLVRNNAETIYRTLRSSVLFPKLSVLLAMTIEKCDLSSPKVTGLINEVHELGRNTPGFSQWQLGSTTLMNHPEHRKLGAQIVSLLGVTPDLWNLSLLPTTTTPIYRYWSGYGGSLELVHHKIISELFGESYDSYFQEYFYGLEYEGVQELKDQLRALGLMSTSRDSEKTCSALRDLI